MTVMYIRYYPGLYTGGLALSLAYIYSKEFRGDGFGKRIGIGLVVPRWK